MGEKYLLLPKKEGLAAKGISLWAISRFINEKEVHLIEDRPLFNKDDARVVLLALGIAPTAASLNRYFPVRKGLRCPTLELLELCNELDSTNPFAKKQKSEVGV